LALFIIICKLVPTKVINVAPKCSLGQKTKSFSQKYLGLGKAKRKVCLIAYEKEEHEGNMLNASRGGAGS
jgi:hypothetical protein